MTTKNVLGDGVGAGKISVLVVGNHSPGIEQFAEMLPRTDWEINQCSKLSDAGRRAGETGCAIVVCDRDECGDRWAEVLASTSRLSEPPLLVVMASHADERLWSEVLDRGGYDVLQKPLERAEVSRVMAMAWRQRCYARHGD